MAADVTLTLSQSGATNYVCRNYSGATVSSGQISGLSFTVTAPSGGWECGWYRVTVTGPNTDANFGNSYGSYNFCIVPKNADKFSTNNQQFYRNYPGGEARDSITKAVLGAGTSRYTIGDVNHLVGSDGNSDFLSTAVGDATEAQTYFPVDPARPWPMMAHFPNGVVFGSDIGAVTGAPFVRLLDSDGAAHAPGTVFYDASDSATAGQWKLRVYYPDSSTLVETIDNLSKTASNSAASAINGSSSYVRAFGYNGTWAAKSVSDVDASSRNGTRTAVSALYAAGVTRFEGPTNEGRYDGAGGALAGDYNAQRMKVFQADVAAATSGGGKAIGPCPVDIEHATTAGFFDSGGGSSCDEISFHAYNSQTNGDINLGRTKIQAWIDNLSGYGLSSKDLWHTEATHCFCANYGVYHPRKSRIPMQMTLLWEQYGLPRERNMVWYDLSHGFWSYPSFWENNDHSLNPYIVLYRTLAAETWGRLHHHRFDFGMPYWNAVLLGSVYTSSSDDTSTLVVVSQTHVPGLTIDVTLLGSVLPTTVTYVDAWGNETVAAVSSGRVTIPVDDIPTYLRLPAGVRCRIYQVADWGTSPNPSISSLSSATIAGAGAAQITDGQYVSNYAGGTDNPGIVYSTASLPTDATIMFNGSVTIDHVLIVAGLAGAWQSIPTLVDFDVQTTTDGTNWTTRNTVTVDCSSLDDTVTAGNNAGCWRDTYWDEQNIFPVSLGGSVTCTGVRAYIRDTSQGGEPNDLNPSQMGFGGAKAVAIQEFVVPSASTPPSFYGAYHAAVEADSPLGYWRLGEASGTTAADSSGNGLAGTYPGGGTQHVSGPVADGNGAYAPNRDAAVSVSYSSLFADTFTIEWWSQGSVGSGYNYLFAKAHISDPSGQSPSLRFFENRLTVFSPGYKIMAQANNQPGGSWHHWVVTKTGSTLRIYCDTVDVTETNPASWVYAAPFTAGTPSTVMTDHAGTLYLGGENGADGFSGSVAEFAVYNTVLPADRIAAHFQSASTPSGTPANTAAPTLEGTATNGGQMSVIAGAYLPEPTKFTYQWQKSTNGGTTWANITGETHSDYVVSGLSAGDEIRCQVTPYATAGAGTAVNSSTRTVS